MGRLLWYSPPIRLRAAGKRAGAHGREIGRVSLDKRGLGQNLPGSIGSNRGWRTVRIVKPRLQQKGPFGIYPSIIPRAHPMPNGREHICAGFYYARNVVRIVLAVMIRIAACRTSPQKLTVEVKDIIVVRSYINLRQNRFASNRKRFSKVSKVIQVCRSIPNVARGPFVCGQASVKKVWFTIITWLAGLIPNPNLPPKPHSRRQAFARVFNRSRLI